MMWCVLIAAVLLNDGVVKIEGEPTVDVARSLLLKVSPIGVDLRARFQGFSLAEDYDNEQGNYTEWRLVPEPCAKEYRIRPFAFAGQVHGPVSFTPPAAREPVTGAMEVNPARDAPPWSWKRIGTWALWVLAGLAVLAVLGGLVRLAVRRVREHRMSPIERAWVELDRLLKKGLPGRGHYKDFYVELTMVVRRYVQRKYGIKAPHLTTEEFLREVGTGAPSDSRLASNAAALKRFLESADMVKFAGLEATPEMADSATIAARDYLKSDSTATGGNRQLSREGAK